MIRIAIAVLVCGSGSALACPPSVTLGGDDDLVGAIHDQLAARGIDIAGGCGEIRAQVVRRDGVIVVAIGDVERVVHEAATAATVIESFTRDDLAASLLVSREIPREPAPPPVPAVIATRPPPSRGVQLFVAAETSVGSDRSNWMGAQLGACVMLGPVCAAARFRVAELVNGDGVWDGGTLDRRGSEILLGIDVPFALRRGTLAFGFAAGLGAMHTRDEATGAEGRTGGLRADVHATFSIPIKRRVALDLGATIDFTQETHVDSAMRLPADPTALLRFGLGLRYGGL